MMTNPSLGAAARWNRWLCLALLLAFGRSWGAQNLQFQAPVAADVAATATAMRDLAARALPVYQDSDRDRYLANLAALQLVAGNFPAGYDALQSLLERLRGPNRPLPLFRFAVYDVYAHAQMIGAANRIAYAQAFTRAFQEVVPRLGDLDAYTVTSWLQTPPADFQQTLQQAFDRLRGRRAITLSEAIDLVQTYLAFEVHRGLGNFVATLVTEDYQRRYVTDPDVLIKTRSGAHIAAVVVLPRGVTRPLPALLEFTLQMSPQNFATECAAHGYAGVVAYTRGKGGSAVQVEPFVHDGDDASAVIDWIARQPWSNGRVGMYGSDYSGFSQWAAAKRLPAALQAIATTAATAPGVDLPMDGNIFLSFMYPWALDAAVKDPAAGNPIDAAQWRTIEQDWYASGKPYRDLDQFAHSANPIFRHWLGHPSYDHYWQKLIPFHKEFARINIPVLATAGYYGQGEAGTLYYFNQHYQFDPQANQTLLIGPYDDLAMRRGPLADLRGYQPDPAALIDLHQLRYQWFDYVLRGGPRPALLQGRVNYQVMGSNQWRHADSLAAMANGSLRFYLRGTSSDTGRLDPQPGARTSFVSQTVNFADRRDAGWTAASAIVSRNLPLHNGIAFISDALTRPMEFNGLFAGRLDFRINKQDVDLGIAFYEWLADGEYVQLFSPQYQLRASYAGDRSTRHLLRAGERQQLALHSDRLTSRRLQAGSRLVMVLSVIKQPDEEINYGTGGDVSEESVADATIPLKLRWYSDSYIDLPVLR